MKSALSRSAAVAAVTLATLDVTHAVAATVYWDADATVNTTYGGTGNWDNSLANWTTAADGTGTDNAWNPADTATFLRGTTDNVITVDAGGVTALALSFGATGGLFTSGTGIFNLSGGKITLTQSGSNTGISSGNGGAGNVSNATIGNVIDFSGSFQITTGTQGANTLALNGGMNNTSATARTLGLNGYTSNATITLGNVTKSAGAGNVSLEIGSSAGGSNNGTTYVLNGNNTGIASGTGMTIRRGTVIVNHASALGVSGVLVSLGGTTAATADTQALLIGTSGVNIARNITLNATDTNDTRVIGSNIASGSATYSGTLTLAGTGASLRADSGGTTVFSGSITDGAATLGITKTGNGVVSLTRGAGNSYDGTTLISAGTLLANNNTSGSATGTGAVTVSPSGTLGGTGFIAPVADASVTINGTLAVGDSVAAADLSIATTGASATTIGATGVVALDLFANTLLGADRLVTGGAVTLNATSTLTVLNTGALTFANGDQFDLFDWESSPTGTFGTINLPLLSDGLTWDSGNLYGTGIIAVVPEPASLAVIGLLAGLLRGRRR